MTDTESKLAIDIAAGISTRPEFAKYESPLVLAIVRATIAAHLRAAESVAEVRDELGFPIMVWISENGDKYPVGTKLFAHPVADAQDAARYRFVVNARDDFAVCKWVPDAGPEGDGEYEAIGDEEIDAAMNGATMRPDQRPRQPSPADGVTDLSPEVSGLVVRLRALSRAEHSDFSIGDEAADELLRLTQESAELRRLCACTYQAAGCYGLPTRFMDALSNAMHNERLHDVDIDKLLPVDPVDWVERAERAEAEVIELDGLRDRLSRILTDTANVLKGPPPPLTSHSWHDLAELAAKQHVELIELRAKLAQRSSRETENDE